MNKFGAGVSFCMLAGILECARYITAGMYMAGGASQSSELFESGLSYVGMRLAIYAATAFAAGAALVIWSIADRRTRK